jgi:7-cyano-7-deazaguanine synthase
MNGIILYSGGMDSTVLLHKFKENIKLALSFYYGSKHNEKEFHYAKLNTNKLGIKHLLLDVSNIFNNFDSDLLKKGSEIPEGHYNDESMKRTVVPFRNGILLSIAAGFAESNSYDTILIANHFGDHMIYPDCRKNFIDPMSEAIKKGTWNEVVLSAPFTEITKREIAFIGKDVGVNFSETYSCYKGGEIHCGKCGTCTERKEALLGFDPTKYLD